MSYTLKKIAFVLLVALSVCHSPLYANDTKTPETTTQQQSAAQNSDEQSLVNINSADLQALQSLPRIGPKTAAKIIAYRDQQGAFKEKRELLNVKGIGQKTYDRLKHLITI